MDKHLNPTKAGFFFLMGVSVGLVASWLLPDKTLSGSKKKTRAAFNYLKEVLTDTDEQERIKDIFKENTQEAADAYRAAREALMSNLSQVKDTWSKIDKDKYMEIIEDTMDEIREKQSLPLSQMNKLRRYFEADYKFIQDKIKKAQAELED